MYNQPFSSYGDSTIERHSHARGRLLILAVLLIGGFATVAGRVLYIQTQIAERFVAPWENSIEEVSPLPCRDGRILSRDGAVLAYDQTQYDLSVEYRWLENPPDPVWLKQQVRQRLNKAERSDPQKVQLVEQQLLAEREALWTRLAEVAEVDRAELITRASAVQTRIERMVAAVEARRAQQKSQGLGEQSTEGKAIHQVIFQELSTPPERHTDPIVLKEELMPHPVVGDVSLEVAAAIRSQPTLYPGVSIASSTTRVYPLDQVAPHLIGMRRKPVDEQGAQRVGESGVERSYQRQLSGFSGERKQTRSSRGELLSDEVTRPASDGNDVTLTIDSRLQAYAESLLDQALAADNEAAAEKSEASPVPNGGCVVVMDVWTGELLVAACAPRHSLALLSDPNQNPQAWNDLLNDPRQPFFPRISRMALPPGSVFKVVTAIAALEEGAASPNELLHCRGYLNSPDQHRCLIYRRYGTGHGDVDLSGALRESCNVYFYKLAQRLGPEKLVDWSLRLGFGQPTGIDLPGEKGGLVPNPADPETARRWYPGSTLQLAIGQGSLLVTPLQVCRMMALVANGGTLVRPLVVQTRPDDGQRGPVTSQQTEIAALDTRTLQTVRTGLEMVVNHPRGTGRSAKLEMLTLAGKTGTAEVAGQTDHAWFAGYVPAKSPRYAFIVVLENGGSGGQAAGPIVKSLAQKMQTLGYLHAKSR